MSIFHFRGLMQWHDNIHIANELHEEVTKLCAAAEEAGKWIDQLEEELIQTRKKLKLLEEATGKRVRNGRVINATIAPIPSRGKK